MNQTTFNHLTQFIHDLAHGNLNIVYDKWPDGYDEYLNQALNQKRAGNYDASLDCYFSVVRQYGLLTTELGRSISKVFTCMQEYNLSLAILYKCASVKWTDITKPPIEVYKIDPVAAKKMEKELPTACAHDLYELIDALRFAAVGICEPIIELSKSKSGNEYAFQNSKTRAEITKEAINALNQAGIDY